MLGKIKGEATDTCRLYKVGDKVLAGSSIYTISSIIYSPSLQFYAYALTNTHEAVYAHDFNIKKVHTSTP